MAAKEVVEDDPGASLQKDIVLILREEIADARKRAYEYWKMARTAEFDRDAAVLRVTAEKAGAAAETQRVLVALMVSLVRIMELAEDRAVAIEDTDLCVPFRAASVRQILREVFTHEGLTLPPALDGKLAPPVSW